MRVFATLPDWLLCLAISIGLPAHLLSQQAAAPDARNAVPEAPAAATPFAAITGAAKPQTPGPMALHERLVFSAHATFGPSAYILPALGSALTMAHPPDHFPHDWSDGAAAYGRNYGAELGANTTGGIAHFVTAAIDHEDPRYYPSRSTHVASRVTHALVFTFVNQGNSGGRALALSNFADSAAAGFVGMAWEPDGFNDPTHALQRSEKQFAKLAGKNLALEFTPEFSRMFRKIHLGHGHESDPVQGSSQP
jgi:hypothetical protein